ncbi:MAG: hypothetical protein HMLKMBBP_03158 [Planctomycetes bacterium]|nr:hypothetical protein [Planctomycetota bacterium]
MTQPSREKRRAWLAVMALGVLFAMAKIAIRALDDGPGEGVRSRATTVVPAPKPRGDRPGGEIPAESRAPRDPEKKRAAAAADLPPDGASGSPPGGGPAVVPPALVRVTNPDGTPAVGAAVHFGLLDAAAVEPGRRIWRTVSADEKGEAVISRMRDGKRASVHVRASGGSRRASPTVRLDADVVTLTLDAALDLSGRVTASEGGPVEGAEVEILAERGGAWTGLHGTTSAPDGSFDLGPISFGDHFRFRVEARAPGRIPAHVDLGGSDFARPVELVLERGRTVRARVVDGRGQGLRVMAAEVPHQVSPQGPFDNGVVELRGVRVKDTFVAVAIMHSGPFAPRIVALPAGTADVELGEIRMTAGGEISGVVTDVQGEPLPHASVFAVHLGSGFEYAMSDPTDTRGAYRLEGLMTESQDIVAILDQGRSTERRAWLRGVAPDMSGVEIRFTGRATVALRFLRAATKEPVSVRNASITARGVGDASDGLSWQWDGSAGPFDSVRFEIERAGTYRVDVAIPGFAPATIESLDVKPDQETRIDILFRDEPR